MNPTVSTINTNKDIDNTGELLWVVKVIALVSFINWFSFDDVNMTS
jgi:hypothetical protein